MEAILLNTARRAGGGRRCGAGRGRDSEPGSTCIPAGVPHGIRDTEGITWFDIRFDTR